MRALVLAQIKEIGMQEVARRLVPLWGYKSIDSVLPRLSRWVNHGKPDLSSKDFLLLLVALDLVIARS